MNYRTSAALAAVFILASRGGGGRDAGPPGQDAGPPGQDAPSFDSIVVGDVLLAAPDRLYRAESSCSGSTCTVTYLGESVTVDLRDIDPSASTTTVADRQTRNGVQTGRLTASDGEIRFDAFGVWGDYNAATTGAGAMSLQGADIRLVVPTSVGYGSAANPVSGGASWAGVMTGVKFGSSGLGAEVAGNATMTVDFDGAALDLDFTNIAELMSGASVGDISWQDVSMQAGSFEDVGLKGRFYGPSHEEAGGVFERDGVVGAFSLKRD